MKEKFIETQNYIRLSEAIARLKELPVTADRMGLAYGNFGLGKTMSLERVTFKEGALLIRADQTWSVNSTLKKLCFELGLDTIGRASVLMERVKEALLLEPRIIIIDEIDTLLRGDKFSVFELFRDIHDETRNIIFFVGMEESLAKIKKHRHYHSRLTELVKFEPIGLEDIKKFCELSEVKIKDDLLGYFAKRYKNLRQIKVFILRLEAWADLNDIDEIGLAEFKASGAEHA